MASLLLAILSTPALLATSEAIRQGQQRERREEHRARRCNLIVSCTDAGPHSRVIDHRLVGLRNSKLYVQTNPKDSTHHPFSGYFLPYPVPEGTKDYEGLVSTITFEAPILNWIYVDAETYEVKYGVKDDTVGQITGPFDCTRLDRRLVLEGWEGFVAVRKKGNVRSRGEGDESWQIYFDRDGDGLMGKLGRGWGWEVLEVELCRREKRVLNGLPLGESRQM